MSDLSSYAFSPFSLAGILLGITCTVLVFVLLVYGKLKIHRIWLLFNISVAMWGYFAFLIGRSISEQEAILNWRLAFVGVIFISVLFYHLSCLFCAVKRVGFIIFAYIQGFLFVFLNIFTKVYISKVKVLKSSIYYIESEGFLFPLSFIIWISLVILGHYELLHSFAKFKGVRRLQARYLFLGFFIGFLGGTTNFFPMFGINIYPYGNFTVTAYCIIVTYAILRYQLLDINVLITRTGIFVVVYSFVLGIPFALAFGWQDQLKVLLGQNWWMVPLLCSTVLATAGPFIYLYMQKRAEDRLLREQRRYQSTLQQASSGMGRIKDLKKLVNLIVRIVSYAVGLEHSAVYLNDRGKKGYILRASRDGRGKLSENKVIDYNSPLITHLMSIKSPVIYEEVKQRAQDFGDKQWILLEKTLEGLNAALVVPSFIEERILAVIILGKKKSGKLYTEDDLNVFSILANQAALAIENAQFYEDMKKTQAQLFKAEKMATIGTLADGLSHQINNRLHALGFIAGDALDSIEQKKDVAISDEIKELLIEMKYAFSRIQDNVMQGGEIVQGLLRYTRKGEEGFTEVEFDKLIVISLEMAQYKVKLNQIFVVRDYAKDLPKIKGNFTQLQEVFFNFIDNAYDAMMQRKDELREPDYKPTLHISAVQRDGYLEIAVADNGIGIKKDDQDKLFAPFFTTKLSSKKGTGLGLYVIQKIIAGNHFGKVSFSSEYKKGSRFVVQLPRS